MFTMPNIGSPLFWALLLGWIMSVVLHEFAHGIVAYWGGDYTIRERGGLTLNPLQYVDPVMSILLPLLFMAMGGIALPGGATFVRRDLLRSKAWNSAVSAAGPVMNLLIFLALAAVMSPRVGWIDWRTVPESWTDAQIFVAGLAFSQLLAMILNLAPVPPLDGYGIIRPYLPAEIRQTLSSPQVGMVCLCGFFLILQAGPIMGWVVEMIFQIMGQVGIPLPWRAGHAFEICLHGT